MQYVVKKIAGSPRQVPVSFDKLDTHSVVDAGSQHGGIHADRSRTGPIWNVIFHTRVSLT